VDNAIRGVKPEKKAINDSIRIILFVFMGIVLVYGLYRAIHFAWVADDAFFSFRYAKNLVNGFGLVFNPGQRVEAYTNFLWTVIIAAGMYLGAEPIFFSQIVSIASYFFTAVLFIYLSYRLCRERLPSGFFFLPLAALALMLQYDFQVYATSGLGTAWTTMLVSLGFTLLVLARKIKHFLLSGLFLVLAAMSRPDALLFYVMALPYALLLGRRYRKYVLVYLVPILAIYLPYWIIRFNYYGYPFPNSYYAKSANLPYYSQGLKYTWLYFKTYYPLLLVIPGIIYVIPALFNKYTEKKWVDDYISRTWLLSIFYIIPYIFYVLRMGGGFMFARFLIPITPVCFFFIESMLIGLLARKNSLRIVLSLLIIAGVFFRWNQFNPPDKRISHIGDERVSYPPEVIEEARSNGAKLKKYLGDLDVRVAFYGRYAMWAYYSDLPAVESATGLTDEYIAHLPLTERSVPGHEKRIPYGYLLDKKINFVLGTTYKSELNDISFDGVPAHIVTYDRRVMDSLRRHPEVKYVDFTEYLDRYIAGIDTIPRAQVRKNFEYFRKYYFEQNVDLARFQAFTDYLNR
jgi:hypothetical protein